MPAKGVKAAGNGFEQLAKEFETKVREVGTTISRNSLHPSFRLCFEVENSVGVNTETFTNFLPVGS